MSLSVNLRQLTRHSTVLKGELPTAALDLETHDEMIQARQPLRYDLEVELVNDSLLVRGSLRITLNCECVRCLKALPYRLELDDWACHLALKGEDKVPIVDDSVDLTAVIREDILLAFPAHPVCDPHCAGLAGATPGLKRDNESNHGAVRSSAWTKLDKLKFRN